MPERFYLPVSLQGGVELDGPEAHHLAHVLRHVAGDEVILFDGRGCEADAHIESVAKRTVRLTILRARITEPEGPPLLTLATAVPKGDRFRWLVEKATELGVDRLIPLETERSIVDPRETKLDKMRQAVVAACKQCGRNRLMEIAATMPCRELLSAGAQDGAVLLADRSGESIFNAVARRRELPVVAAVGPEGGWTDDERRSARDAGAVSVNLGRWILRIETAALAIAAACSRDRPALRSEATEVLRTAEA